MKLIYNPIENGSPIEGFTFNYIKYEHPVGKILQYKDDVGEALLKTYEYLQELTKAEAEKALEDLKAQYRCKVCKKGFGAAIALEGHMRSHPNEVLEEEKIDPSIIPVAEGQATNAYQGAQTPQMQKQANPGYVDGSLTNDSQDAAFLDFGSYEKSGS